MIIRTERLTIRWIEAEDWRAVKEIWDDFKKSDYVIYDNYKDTAEESIRPRIAAWADFSRSGTEHRFFAICLDGEVIGYTSMNRRPDGYEIGYGFVNRAQGKGYAKESLTAILAYMKENGVKKVCAGTARKNVPSVKLLTGLGFKLVGTETVSFYQDAEGNDICFEGGIFEKSLL